MTFRLLIALCVMALLQGVAIVKAQDVPLNPQGVEWDANVEPDLTFYRVYQTTNSGMYVFGSGNEYAQCTKDVTQLIFNESIPHSDGTHFWVVTAVDAAGNESGPSNEVTAAFDHGAPAPPTGCAVIP